MSAQLAPANVKARDRILIAAYDLFSRHGIRAVGIDAIIRHSGVARMTLYRHFASKDDLVLAFLDRRETLWTAAWLQAEIERRAQQPIDQLLAIFDVFSDWFRRDDFEGCSFINVTLEISDHSSAIRHASVLYLERIRIFLERLAKQAGIPDTAAFACKWHLLMKGSIIAAAEGDADAGQRARQIGVLVLAAALAVPPSSVVPRDTY
jgi:AcrR family transcriptional regulator